MHNSIKKPAMLQMCYHTMCNMCNAYVHNMCNAAVTTTQVQTAGST
jgi:hypothetical protein